MKYPVNDECGSKIIGSVLLPSGLLATAGEHFVEWSGTYHKNGKWSYTEGGIATRQEVWFLINIRSTHSSANNQKMIVGLNVGSEGRIVNAYWTGSWKETASTPSRPIEVPELVYEVIFSFVPAEHLDRWKQIDHFI